MVIETFTVSKKAATPVMGLHLYERLCGPNNVVRLLRASMVPHRLVRAHHRNRRLKGAPRDRPTSHRRYPSPPSTALKQSPPHLLISLPVPYHPCPPHLLVLPLSIIPASLAASARSLLMRCSKLVYSMTPRLVLLVIIAGPITMSRCLSLPDETHPRACSDGPLRTYELRHR
jgi:hypothetical protein